MSNIRKTFCNIPSLDKHTVLCSDDQSTPEEEPIHRVAATVDDLENDDLDELLTSHPAKKNVMNFMRVIIVDSLSLLSSPKVVTICIRILEFYAKSQFPRKLSHVIYLKPQESKTNGDHPVESACD